MESFTTAEVAPYEYKHEAVVLIRRGGGRESFCKKALAPHFRTTCIIAASAAARGAKPLDECVRSRA